MKNTAQNIWTKTLGILVLLATLASCGDMFSDPTKDKETGEDINLLIVDFNFFTTRMTYKLIDVSDGSPIIQEARVTFTGNNSNDIVDFVGKKEAQRTTTEGQLELTIDPTVDFSSASPFEFTVHVSVDGYEDFSQNIQLKTVGKKSFDLELSPILSGNEETLSGQEDGDSFVFSVIGTKSAVVEGSKPYTVNYSVKKEDMLKFTDANGNKIFASLDEMMAEYQNNPATFFQLKVDIKTGYSAILENVWDGGEKDLAIFQKLETGNLVALILDGKWVKNLNGGVITQSCIYNESPAPDLFGFAKMQLDAWNLSTEPLVYSSLNIAYTVASASLEELCPSGATINFTSNSKTSFSIDADLLDTEGKLIRTMNFKGTFPEKFILEDVPKNLPGRLVFKNNNPAFDEISPLEVNNFCSGSYDVDVQAKDGYSEYQIVLKAYCAENASVAVAPTYSGEIRIKNSEDAWQGVDMIGGVVDVLAKPNQEYQLRFLWESEWQFADFHTKFDADGNYLAETDLKISSEVLPDGRIRIIVDHVFDQWICNDLGW